MKNEIRSYQAEMMAQNWMPGAAVDVDMGGGAAF